MTILVFSVLIIVHILGVLNSMYMWPQCVIDENGNHTEVDNERTLEQNIKYVFFWEIGTMEILIEDIRSRLNNPQ